LKQYFIFFYSKILISKCDFVPFALRSLSVPYQSQQFRDLSTVILPLPYLSAVGNDNYFLFFQLHETFSPSSSLVRGLFFYGNLARRLFGLTPSRFKYFLCSYLLRPLKAFLYWETFDDIDDDLTDDDRWW